MEKNYRIYHPGESFPMIVRSMVIIFTFFCFLIYTGNIIYIDEFYNPNWFKILFNLNKYLSLSIFILGMLIEVMTGYYITTKNSE